MVRRSSGRKSNTTAVGFSRRLTTAITRRKSCSASAKRLFLRASDPRALPAFAPPALRVFDRLVLRVSDLDRLIFPCTQAMAAGKARQDLSSAPPCAQPNNRATVGRPSLGAPKPWAKEAGRQFKRRRASPVSIVVLPSYSIRGAGIGAGPTPAPPLLAQVASGQVR